jgi:hypothetical protein
MLARFSPACAILVLAILEHVFRLRAQESTGQGADQAMVVLGAEHATTDAAGDCAQEATLALLWVVWILRIAGVAIGIGGVTGWWRTLSPWTALAVVVLSLLLLSLLAVLILAVLLLLTVLLLLAVLILTILRLALAVIEAALLRWAAVRSLPLLLVSLLTVVRCGRSAVALLLPVRLLPVSALIAVLLLLPAVVLLAVLALLVVLIIWSRHLE